MKKSILFKRTRESVIRKLSNPYIREKSRILWIYVFNIRNMLYANSLKRNK